MTDYILIHEDLSRGQQKLVGLYQEAKLRQDETGGSDGMWFNEAVEAVNTDTNAALAFVVDFFKTTDRAVIKHCGL